MILSSVAISGYRSIPTDLIVKLRPTLTCFIGANEHGKSNILDAIAVLNNALFNPHDRNSETRDPESPHVRFQFELTPIERKRLVSFLEAEAAKRQEKADSTEGIETKAAQHASAKRDVDLHLKTASHYKDEARRTIEIVVNADGTRTVDLGRMTYGPIPPDADMKFYIGSSPPIVRLFTPSDELADSVTLADLNNQTNLPFEGLLKLAKCWDEREALFEGNIQSDRLLLRGGKTLTRKLRNIWSQGAKHTFRLQESAGNLRLTIEDPTTLDMPSRRSLGFRSFLSFALSLYAETAALEPEGFVLLFDEPGIHLHPQGQKDLLRELRRLSARNQIAYTTHSPFLIDRNDLDATLLVTKETVGSKKGTRIHHKPYGANWAPLSAALGMTPADALFPPDISLLVEGTSDRAYIAKYMQLTKNDTGADLNYLNLIDSDRREEMEAVARILVDGGRQIVVLGDGDEGGKQWTKWIKRIAGSKRSQLQVIDMPAVAGMGKQVSIEDLLPFDFVVAATRTYVKDTLGSDKAIDDEDILTRSKTTTLGRAIGDYLTSIGVISHPSKLSKTNIADILCRMDLPVPDKTQPIAKLCMEITRCLGLVG